MQLDRTSRRIFAPVLALGLLLGSISATTPATAEEPDDEARLIEEGVLIDASKHGTVEAEIPADRESTKPPATAAEVYEVFMTPQWDRGGFFIGFSAGFAAELSKQIGGLNYVGPSGGGGLRLGIKHDRWMTTEFSFVGVAPFNYNNIKYWGWGGYFGERVYFTKTRLQPYVGVGLGFMMMFGTAYNPHAFGYSTKFNTGVDYVINRNYALAVDLAYHMNIGNIDDTDFVTLSLGIVWY